jgi:hypothetical protein
MADFVWYPSTIDSNSATLEDFVDKIFYGVRQDSATGHATIEKIAGDSPISLPSATSQSANDYRNWMWTNNTFTFSWNNATGHLLMEVL